jgi:tetratricopeptide (TPR) repeat protein
MDQLAVLHEINESFSKRGDRLCSIDPESIEGSCSAQMVQLLEGAKIGKIDADICSELVGSLQDVYEVKRLGDICKKAGLFELAIRCYNRAITLTKDKEVRAVLLNNLGQVYAYFGDLGRAAAYYKRALKVFECAGDGSGLAHVQGNLGSAYRRAKEWDKAIEYCHKSLKAFQELGDDQGAAQMTGNLGRIYADMGEIGLASRHYEKSLSDFKRLGDRQSEAWILYWLGKISAKEKKWDQSIEYYNKSRSIFEQLGYESSSGIILSNMGRAYLESGDGTKSKEYLERSLKLLQKEMRPAYRNAVAWLAANYGVLAKEHRKKANQTLFTKASAEDWKELLRQAAQHYSQAANRYLDLATMDDIDIPDLRATASIARFLSALSELQAANRDEEAIKQSEKVIAALKEAAVSSSGINKEKMDAIEKILTGMKGVWSSGHIDAEIELRSNALAQSVKLFLGGVCFAGEAVVFIYDALGSIESALENEKSGLVSLEQLGNAASSLRKVEKWFKAEGNDLGIQSAIQVGNAATIFEKLLNFAKNPGKEGISYIKAPLVYKSYKDALLTIGWILIENALPAIDKTDYIYSWDESLNLVEKGSAEHSDAAKKIQDRLDNNRECAEEQIMEELEVEPVGELVYETNETCQIEKNIERPIIKEQIISNGPAVDAIAANECCMMPAMTQVIQLPEFSKVAMLPEKEQKASYKVDRIEPLIDDLAFGKAGSKIAEEMELPAEAVRADRYKAEPLADFMQSSDSRSSAASPKEKQEMLYTFGIGIVTKSNAINALKALTVVVLGLLAIDVILYLI